MEQQPIANIQKKKRDEILCRNDPNCKNPRCAYKHTVAPSPTAGKSRTLMDMAAGAPLLEHPTTPRCIYFDQGNCNKGANCPFLHIPPGQTAPQPPTSPKDQPAINTPEAPVTVSAPAPASNPAPAPVPVPPPVLSEQELRERAMKNFVSRKKLSESKAPPAASAPATSEPVPPTEKEPAQAPAANPAPAQPEQPAAPRKLLLKRKPETKKIGTEAEPIVVDSVEPKPEVKAESAVEAKTESERPLITEQRCSLLAMMDEDVHETLPRKAASEPSAPKPEEKQVPALGAATSIGAVETKTTAPPQTEAKTVSEELPKPKEVAPTVPVPPPQPERKTEVAENPEEGMIEESFTTEVAKPPATVSKELPVVQSEAKLESKPVPAVPVPAPEPEKKPQEKQQVEVPATDLAKAAEPAAAKLPEVVGQNKEENKEPMVLGEEKKLQPAENPVSAPVPAPPVPAPAEVLPPEPVPAVPAADSNAAITVPTVAPVSVPTTNPIAIPATEPPASVPKPMEEVKGESLLHQSSLVLPTTPPAPVAPDKEEVKSAPPAATSLLSIGMPAPVPMPVPVPAPAPAAPAKRKMKLIDIANEFEDYLKKSSGEDDAAVLKKYGLEPMEDSSILGKIPIEVMVNVLDEWFDEELKKTEYARKLPQKQFQHQLSFHMCERSRSERWEQLQQ